MNRQTLVSGTVNGKSVNRLETGAERTLVDSSLIQEKDKIGEIIRVRAFNGTILALSLAKVRIQIGEHGGDLTVACSGKPRVRCPTGDRLSRVMGCWETSAVQ